jgi:hypothetical protein
MCATRSNGLKTPVVTGEGAPSWNPMARRVIESVGNCGVCLVWQASDRSTLRDHRSECDVEQTSTVSRRPNLWPARAAEERQAVPRAALRGPGVLSPCTSLASAHADQAFLHRRKWGGVHKVYLASTHNLKKKCKKEKLSFLHPGFHQRGLSTVSRDHRPEAKGLASGRPATTHIHALVTQEIFRHQRADWPERESRVTCACRVALLLMAIDKVGMRQKRFKIFTCFISRTRRYMAGHELNPNRDIKRR